MQNNIDKVKNGLNSYLQNSRLSPIFDILEKKIRIDRSLIAIGLFGILGVYLTIGWGNSFVCNLIGVAYPAFLSLMAVISSKRFNEKQLLVYWIVYGLLNCIESVGYGLFGSFLFGIDCFKFCVSHSSTFYWLAKCIFLIWFLNSGSRMIGHWFVRDVDVSAQNPDTIVPNTDEFSGNIVQENNEFSKDIENSNDFVIRMVPDESDEEDEEEQEEQEEREEREFYEIEDEDQINLETLLSKNDNTSTLNLSQITLSDIDIKVLGNILQSNKVRK